MKNQPSKWVTSLKADRQKSDGMCPTAASSSNGQSQRTWGVRLQVGVGLSRWGWVLGSCFSAVVSDGGRGQGSAGATQKRYDRNWVKFVCLVYLVYSVYSVCSVYSVYSVCSVQILWMVLMARSKDSPTHEEPFYPKTV